MIKSNLSSTYIFWRVYSLLNQNLILFLSISSDLRLYLKLVIIVWVKGKSPSKIDQFSGYKTVKQNDL